MRFQNLKFGNSLSYRYLLILRKFQSVTKIVSGVINQKEPAWCETPPPGLNRVNLHILVFIQLWQCLDKSVINNMKLSKLIVLQFYQETCFENFSQQKIFLCYFFIMYQNFSSKLEIFSKIQAFLSFENFWLCYFFIILLVCVQTSISSTLIMINWPKLHCYNSVLLQITTYYSYFRKSMFYSR